jgi:Helix-turn-helix domain
MKLCSPKTVAKTCDVDRSTAYRWMRNGVLPAFELLPGQWRCYEDALQRFIRKKARKTTGREDRDLSDGDAMPAKRSNFRLSAHQADNKGTISQREQERN